MSNYDNNMKAAIWKNDKREKDTHPHFKGNALIDGVEYYVSAWKRAEGANQNAPALKMSFTKVSDVKDKAMGQVNQTMSNPPPVQHVSPPPIDNFDDELPF